MLFLPPVRLPHAFGLGLFADDPRHRLAVGFAGAGGGEAVGEFGGLFDPERRADAVPALAQLGRPHVIGGIFGQRLAGRELAVAPALDEHAPVLAVRQLEQHRQHDPERRGGLRRRGRAPPHHLIERDESEEDEPVAGDSHCGKNIKGINDQKRWANLSQVTALNLLLASSASSV